MIDWFHVEMVCDHPAIINGGWMLSINEYGEPVWETAKYKSIEGSHDSSIRIRTESVNHDGVFNGLGDSLISIRGNFTKFLQGHNVFGVNDVNGIVNATFEKLQNILSLTPTPGQLNAIREGRYKVTMIDITESYDLGSQERVLTWLRAAEKSAHMKYRGKGHFTGDTLYFAKHSRRSALKFYPKGQEMEAHKKQTPLLRNTRLLEYAKNLLRAEVRIHSTELKERGLRYGHQWIEGKAEELYTEVIGKLEITENVMLTTSQMDQLPPRLKGVYTLWHSGYDLRTMYAKNTYYRYRKELKEFGIDIAVQQETEPRTNVIPLIQVLEAKPAVIPDWAEGTPLLFEPPYKYG